MKFIVSSSELFSYLQVISKVVPSRAVIPLVTNFLFEVSSEGIKITATDLETTMVVNIEPITIEGEGSFVVEAKRLLDILKEFSKQPLEFEIEQDSNVVIIKSETGKFTIPSHSNVDEFPLSMEMDVDNANEIILPADTLQRGINYTFFGVSDDDLRPIMTGINVVVDTDSLTFVSSDSQKLIKYQRLDVTSESSSSFVLPKKPAELLRAVLSKTDDDVTIRYDEQNATFKMSNYLIVCRLLEGEFPDYEAVMPKNNNHNATISRSVFHTIIRRISLFANESSKLVKLKFDDSQLEISAQDIDFSISAYEKMNCQYEDEEMSIGFKSTFLLEVLQNIDSDEVVVSMSDAQSATLVYPAENEENENLVMLIMPLGLDS